MKVEYVDHMGSDLTVANAARVSFNKHKDQFDGSDERLITYLAIHNHWTPFAHPQITLRMTAPIPIRTQCFKHKQGFVENEISRRYVDDEPEFFFPVWRGKPEGNAKQGSSDKIEDKETCMFLDMAYERAISTCDRVYATLIEEGVAPEQARFVLPQAMYTSWYWTGSLAAYARFCKQRLDPHAQGEVRDLAKMTSDIIQPLFPVSWEVLIGDVK